MEEDDGGAPAVGLPKQRPSMAAPAWQEERRPPLRAGSSEMMSRVKGPVWVVVDWAVDVERAPRARVRGEVNLMMAVMRYKEGMRLRTVRW